MQLPWLEDEKIDKTIFLVYYGSGNMLWLS
jgi:hypothetical protein